MIKTVKLFLFLLFSTHFCFAQKCEMFREELFRGLPNDIPNEINCVDSLGRKQGWWIYYEIEQGKDSAEYNQNGPKCGLSLDINYGDYVSYYKLGKYVDGNKAGRWYEISNRFYSFPSNEENYYYSKDTILIKYINSHEETTLYFNSDSTIIKSKTIYLDKDSICIECRRKNKKTENNCKLYYQNKLMKSFPYKDFEFEFDKIRIGIDRQKYKRLLEINSK